MKTRISRLGQGCFSVVILAISGAITEPLTRSSPMQKELAAESGWHRSLWGGFSDLAADLSWIGVYRAWTKQDLRKMRHDLDRVVSLNPKAVHFWLNGARILAYDVYHWRAKNLPEVDRARVRVEQLQEALAFLDRGLRANPGRYEFGLEKAVMQLKGGSDTEGALKTLESIESMEGLPHYIGRIRGELLVSLGRFDQAEQWLRQFLLTLPPEESDSGREVVRRRIEELERSRARK